MKNDEKLGKKQTKMNILINVIVFLFCALGCRASSPRTPYPFYCSSKNGSIFTLKVLPEFGSSVASIECLRLNYDGSNKSLWKILGEYSYTGDVFMAYDGQHLVRIRPPSARMPVQDIPDWSFVEFFRNGKKVASLNGKDLNLKGSGFYSMGVSSYLILGSYNVALIDGDSLFFQELMSSIDRKKLEGESGLFLIKLSERINLFRLSDGVKIIDQSEKEFNSRFENSNSLRENFSFR